LWALVKIAKKIDVIHYKNNTPRSFAQILSLKLAQKNENYS